MTKYVDGFVIVSPIDKIEEYKKMAEDGAKMWMKYGALQYFECLGDDLEPKEMGGERSLGFLEMTKANPDETVWFSFVIYKSKEHRDEVNAKVMEEMGKEAEKFKDIAIPFDMNRMATGGFQVVVEG